MNKAEWTDAADLVERLGPKPRTWMATLVLAYGTLGIIYGDIGTSPLYTFATIFSNVASTDADDGKMGLSLIFWSLTLVALFKYALVVLHANDNGEGGTFALYSRLCRSLGVSPFGTLQAAEHQELITMSKKPQARPVALTSVQSGGLGRILSSLHSPTPSPHPLATTSKLGQAPSLGLSPLNPVPEDPAFAKALAQAAPASDAAGATHHHHRQVGIRLPAPAVPGGEVDVDALRAPTRWWNRGAIPAEPIKRWMRSSAFGQRTLLIISIFATSLMLGDGVLTPAQSVVSAISGLTVATSNVTQDMVVGISCAILVVLFSLQFYGTDKVAFSFSPIVVLWLLSNAIIGIYNLSKNGPDALQGLSPYWIYAFFQRYGGHTAWQMLGSVMLSVTGAEALFADLGHFSYASVTISWVGFAYPCLVLTYIGQASHVMVNPGDMSSLFWSTVPHSVFWPMLVLATLAAIVASQAIISAAFSICKQARALGCFPKMQIINTSPHHSGQIYVPAVNWILMILTVAVIAGFNGDSVRLGNAYGLTISAVMLITTGFVTLLAIIDWRLSAPLVVGFAGLFGLIDGAFFTANLTKVEKGGWVALAIGGCGGLINLIWWAGQRRHRQVIAKLEASTMGAQPFTYVAASKPSPAQGKEGKEGADAMQQQLVVARYVSMSHSVMTAFDLGMLRGDLALALKHPSLNTASPLVVMPGVALHYSDDSSSAISAVLRHIINNQEAMHEVNLLVTVRRLPVPRVADQDRLLVRTLPQLPNFYQVIVRYGYTDQVDFDQDLVNDIVTAVVTVLADGAGIRAVNLAEAVDSTVEHDRPVAEGLMDVHSQNVDEFRAPNPALATVSRSASSRVHLTTASRRGGATRALNVTSVGAVSRGATISGAIEIQVADGDLNARSVPAPSPSPAQRMSVDLNTMSRTVQASHLGHLLRQASGAPTSAAAANLMAGSKEVKDPVEYLQSLATLAAKGGESLPAELEEAALRVAALFKAAKAGCVYYCARTTLRPDPRSNPARRFLMESLYRPMLVMSYADHEEWHVPLDHLIEVGMAIRA